MGCMGWMLESQEGIPDECKDHECEHQPNLSERGSRERLYPVLMC